jgi:hypothetical protein
MAFAGTPAFLAAGARAGAGKHLISELTGATLAATVGAVDPTGAAADTGALTSNTGAIDAVPANHNSLPAEFGPGPDNWSQGDIDSLSVIMDESSAVVTKLSYSKALVPNVAPAPAGSSITNANAQILIHSLGGIVAGLTARLILEHSLVR